MNLINSSFSRQDLSRKAGFTLLELLIVLVILGIMLGAVTLTSIQTDKQRLQTDAQRIAVLLQLAREEAIVRNHPTAFEVNQQGYQFIELLNGKWVTLSDLDTLRAREFSFPSVRIDIEPNEQLSSEKIRILFGREPVSKPFILHMQVAENRVAIQADGVGHFTVE